MIPRFCRRSCLGSGRADARRNALQLCARLSYSRPQTCTGAGALTRARTFSSYDLLHIHTLGAGALTRAVSLHRHANERIVLLAKDDTGTCLLLCPVALLQATDHCSVLGQVNFTNCPLAGRVVIEIRMGVVRPEQGKLQEPLGYFGKRVARLALFRCKCPRCTSGMFKCTSASPASTHHI